ncbi:MAG: hypothetical protein K0R15_1483 [Clostridiales bacterium]|jgi:lysophospholipase L1-like esterase|nr:hypothetical protein [Clostridiales bacterium]
MKKRIFGFLLVTVMIIGMIPSASFAKEESKTTFSDMPNDWSTTALETAVENGLLSGYEGKINPKDNLTRAEMATIINKAFGTSEKATLDSYSDITTNKWYYNEMAKAVQMEVFKGNGGKLSPEKDITREEAFVVLASALRLSGANEAVLDVFSDKAFVSTWAKNSISSLVAEGYVTGSNGQLNPKKYVTRAEFAQLMINIFNNYLNTAGTYTMNFTGNVMINAPGVILKDIIIKGDLIIGDGIKQGEVTLDNVAITGRTVIRGGEPRIIQTEVINKYIALGDSITYGMSATNNSGYVNLFYNELKTKNENVGMVLQNLGKPGDKSSDLLNKLKNDDATIKAVSNAKIISVSIGGNNLLSPVINALFTALNINPTSENFENDVKIALSDPNSQSKLFAAIPGLQSSLKLGVEQFSKDWVEINEIIKNLAPDAEVYVMTLYNPIKQSDPLYNLFNPVIQGINSTINLPNSNYKVADVNTAFQTYLGADSLVNFNLFTGQIDPHPTNKGHEVIFNSHINAKRTPAPIGLFGIVLLSIWE